MTFLRLPAVLMVVAYALTACGSDTESSGGPGGDEPTTAGALAYVASAYTGTPDKASAAKYGWPEEFKGKAVAAELRYHVTGESDGDLVSIVVGTKFDMPRYTSCAGVDDDKECADLDGGGTLLWQQVVPESDPGLITVVLPKGGATVIVSYSGPNITKDPREMDLPVSTDDLIALAHDDRVDITTSQDAIDHGTDLDYWES